MIGEDDKDPSDDTDETGEYDDFDDAPETKVDAIPADRSKTDTEADGAPIDELAAANDRISVLEMELMEKNMELNHYLVRASELSAEMDNFKKRSEREVERVIERKRRDMLLGFLEVMDDFDRALESEAFVEGKGDAEASAVIEGVKLVRQRFLAKLREFGVERMDVDGAEFDPNVHEAMAVVPATADQPAGQIISVIRPGYMAGGELLRAAGVAVAK